MRRMAGPGATLALALAGCGSGDGGGGNAARFSGEAKNVARAIDDLQAASRAGDAGKICDQLFTRRLVGDISRSTGGKTCPGRVRGKVISDKAQNGVRSVSGRGARATPGGREPQGHKPR